MPQNTAEQLRDVLHQSNKILITTTADSEEGLVLSLILKQVFKLLSKPADLVIAPSNKQARFDFLPGWSEILPEVKRVKKCLLEIDIAETGLQELSYDVTDKRLTIFLTPKKGYLENKQITLKNSDFAYDAIFVLNTESLELLGDLYTNHRDLFQKIPVINIDHKPTNDRFGHLNWVDITLPSSAQQIVDFISLFPEISLANLATPLLTALIVGTKNFQQGANQVSALELASSLIRQGADREFIIKKLYQTKTLSNLKLWGRALSRLQEKGNGQIIWSYLTNQDFLETQAQPGQIMELMEELFLANPRAEILTLFIEKSSAETLVFCQTKNNYPLSTLAKAYSPTGNKYTITFTLPKSMIEAQSEILLWLEKQVLIN